MTATGTFEIKLEPQQDETAPAGRLLIDKVYTGGLVGTGIGQMLSKRAEGGSAAYVAVEEFNGTLDGKKGAFTVVHKGLMNQETQSLEILILEGSGQGELETISGSLDIKQADGVHSYELKYSL